MIRTSRSTGSRPATERVRRGLIVRAAGMLLLLASGAIAQDLQDHDNYRGVWVKSPAVEAFVATAPKFRILAVRKPGGESLLADGKIDDQGLRLGFMGPGQVKTSFDVGNQPGEVIERTDAATRVRLTAADGLRYTVTIAADAKQPRLTLTYELENLADAPRTVSCWSVSSFPCDGMILVPTGAKPRARRRLVLPWWARWPQPGVVFGRDAMSADTAAAGNAAREPGVCKIGLITDAGWAAFVRGGSAVVSTVHFDPAGTYPEDGANVTIFQTAAATGSRAEIEQVGALKALAKGERVKMVETLDVLQIPAAGPPPADNAPGLAGEADALRKRIESAMPAGRSTP